MSFDTELPDYGGFNMFNVEPHFLNEYPENPSRNVGTGGSLPRQVYYDSTLPGRTLHPTRPGENVDEMLVENEVEEDQHNPAGAPQPLTTNADDKKRLACPYYKRYPNKFKRQRTCFGPGFIGIHRLKEHLCRRHGSPPHSCNRCLRGFDTPEALSEHQRALSVCSVASDQQVEGKMTAVQQRELQSMRRTRGRTIEDKWREIYRILFPESNPRSIPSPYFEDEETEREHLSLSDSPEAPDVRIAHGTFSPSLVRTFKTEIFRLLNSHYSDAVAMKGLDHGSAVVERLNGGRKSFRLKLSDDSTMELYDNTAMAEKLYTCVCKFFRPKV